MFHFNGFAQIDMPTVFSDNMVLQHRKSVPIWGAVQNPNEDITVTFYGEMYRTTSDEEGKWMIWTKHLPTIKNDQTIEIKASVSGSKTITGVLAGEVWLCSGQSNMFNQFRPNNVPDESEFEPNRQGFRYNKHLQKFWTNVSFEKRANLSRTAFFFGREIYDKLNPIDSISGESTYNVPVGLIIAATSGSKIESWMTPDRFHNHLFPELISKDVNSNIFNFIGPNGREGHQPGFN